VPLDPQAQAFIERASSRPAPPPGSVPLADFRAAVRAMSALDYDLQEVAEVRDVVIPRAGADDLTVRVYRPAGDGPLPIAVWAHGGSWVRGDVEASDRAWRLVANESGCIVVGVEYALAPESPFPGPLEDVYDAAVWARDHAEEIGGDPRRLIIGGESSGGGVAAGVALLARERGGPEFAQQVLIVPLLDATLSSPSWQELGEDYMLTRPQLEWALGLYAPGVDPSDGLLSPALADDLSGLPPALIVTGEYDPLRDDGERYAQRLEAAGIPATHVRYAGMIHHAVLAPKAIELGRTAYVETARALGRAVGSGTQVGA
jgi:acetyl esterase